MGILSLFLLLVPFAYGANEIIVMQSDHSVEQSIEKLKNILAQKGFGAFGVIDHGKIA